ncbi:RNA polymerase sigma-70 factor, ECF subfamily [Dyadobacter soli]|uniref:RNA polymerase sigma-70 factor, ECF subfamily n=1 Tax=Dyadobacter soli TaxID=659014 RepID=A0A1G7XMI7_9BACT|nr:sigma-70 family RNA polymerase sigma factor [Dyadobacter soli]SDG84870.1 RNA polymerase sigma-70 factor, ECF subfamily [Dyadobacter soli]
MADLHENTAPLLIQTDKSFEELYHLHWEKVFAICYQGTRDTEQAEDLMHEIFQSLWERRSELRVQGPAAHYLVRAAKLKIMAHHRDSANRRQIFDQVVDKKAGSEETTQRQVDYHLLSERVTELVADLPHPCQEVFVMSRQEGLSNKAIAASLVLSEKTVEYHLTRALRFLGKHLAEYQH